MEIEIRSRQGGKIARARDLIYKKFIAVLDELLEALKDDDLPIDDALYLLNQAFGILRIMRSDDELTQMVMAVHAAQT